MSLEDLRNGTVLGWIGFGNDSPTKDIAQINGDGESLLVTVLYQPDGIGVSNWFHANGNGIVISSPPEEGTTSAIPGCFWIYDESTNPHYYILIGCEGRGVLRNSRYGFGRGTLAPRYVVAGKPGIDYSLMNEVRTTTPFLAGWSGLAGICQSFSSDDCAVDDHFKIEVCNEKPVELVVPDFDVALKLVPSSAMNTATVQNIEVSLTAGVELVTVSNIPLRLEEHMGIHDEIRLLTGISSWEPTGFSGIQLKRYDDYFVSPEGKDFPAFWREVLSYRYPHQDEIAKQPHFLFTLEDIGVQGIAKWFELRKKYPEGLDELVYLSWSHDDLIPPAQAILIGVAFESLGYVIQKTEGLEARKLEQMVNLVLTDMSNNGYLPIGDPEKFAHDMAETYNCLKHADRHIGEKVREEYLAPQNVFEVDSACEILLRVWVAEKIGCPADRLMNNVLKEKRLQLIQERWGK